MSSALVFDRDRVDEVVDWASGLDGLEKSSILWIDLDGVDRAKAEELAEGLGLDGETVERLVAADHRQPYLGDFGEYLHVTAYAPAAETLAPELVKVECLVAKQWVVTIHEQPIEAFESYSRWASESSGEIGRLDGLDFVANLVEWVLGSYLASFEHIELALDEFDERAMASAFDTAENDLERLVALRREIGRLRRALVAHRPLFLSLARPEFEAITETDHSERFGVLRSQLEDAVQAARDSRESVVGSFDVLVARTGQRTNEIMKVLTLTSVLLLPGALLAGIMGMNFKLGLFEHNALFWVVIALILAIAATTLGVAKQRRWI
jgi:magnesium transporter